MIKNSCRRIVLTPTSLGVKSLSTADPPTTGFISHLHRKNVHRLNQSWANERRRHPSKRKGNQPSRSVSSVHFVRMVRRACIRGGGWGDGGGGRGRGDGGWYHIFFPPRHTHGTCHFSGEESPMTQYYMAWFASLRKETLNSTKNVAPLHIQSFVSLAFRSSLSHRAFCYTSPPPHTLVWVFLQTPPNHNHCID